MKYRQVPETKGTCRSDGTLVVLPMMLSTGRASGAGARIAPSAGIATGCPPKSGDRNRG